MSCGVCGNSNLYPDGQCGSCGWGDPKKNISTHKGMDITFQELVMLEAKLKTHEEMAIITKAHTELMLKVLKKIADDRSPPWDKMDYQAVAREALRGIE
jgi:hypothetical protein